MVDTEQIYYSSIQLLHAASTPQGFATYGVLEKSRKTQACIVTREAALCALAGLVSGDNALQATGKRSLVVLAQSASDIGHIPAGITQGEVTEHISPSVDSVVWWLLAFWLYTQKSTDTSLRSKHYATFQDGLTWLKYRMQYGLLEQGEGGDWADTLPRSGIVLYTNALWLIFLTVIKSAERDTIARNAHFFLSKEKIDTKAFPDLAKQYPQYRKNVHDKIDDSVGFIAGASHFSIDTSFDVYGHVLLLLSDTLPKKQREALVKKILHIAQESPALLRCIESPQRYGRGIFEKEYTSTAWQYHNAGCFPLIGGLYVVALMREGFKREAVEMLDRLATELSQDTHQYSQWLHGRTGKPVGATNNTATAAAYVLAYRAVHDQEFLW